MTHLKIIQNNGATEEVSSSVILKLYELASSGDLDNTSILLGRINAPSAKISHVNYFMPLSGQKPYPEFYVTATILGLDFEDPEVERICVERFGSNGIVNALLILSVHYLNNYGNNRPFSNNTNITKFNEFLYFTGLVNDNMNGASTGWVFYGCSNLSEITLPDNMPCIGVNMFVGCSSLTSITIPNSVRNVFSNGFSGCTQLQSLTFTGLTGRCDIGDHMTSLSSVTLNEGVQTLRIENSALTELTLPSTINTLELEQNTSLRRLILSPNHTTIMLHGLGLGSCSLLLEIVNYRPNTFTYDYNLFYGWGGINMSNIDIIVPEGITLANSACCYRSVLHSVDLPSTLTEVAFRAFEQCSLTHLIIRATTPPTLSSSNVFDGSYDNAGGCPIYVPDASVESYKTASDRWLRYATRIKKLSPYEVMNGLLSVVPAECFKDDTTITSADFTNANITSIDHGAFQGCTGLTTLDTSNCTSIGYGGFNGCTNLTTIDLSSVTSVGSSVFNNCSSLTSIGTNNTINFGIGDNNQFRNCSSLPSVNVTGSAKIGLLCFLNCTSLASVTLGSTVTEIGSGAFSGCTALTSINLSNITTFSGTNQFYGCTHLATVTGLNSTVTTVPENCFKNCTALTSIDLSNVTSFGTSAFLGCTSLAIVTWPSSNYTLGGAAFKNSGLTGDIDLSNCTTADIFETYRNVFAGSKITSIYNCVNAVKFGDYDNANIGQFTNCTELVKADFSLALFTNADGSKAFVSCKKLKYVKFPSTLTTIGSIFGWTSYNNTIKIYLPCTTIPTFRNTNAKLNETYNLPQYVCNIEVYVPDAKVTDYQSSDWGSYTILPISQYSES